MTASRETAQKRLAINRTALRDYFVLDRIEAGIQLKGTEIKSIRAGGASLAGSYVTAEDQTLFLINANIAPYEFGNKFNHDPLRRRKLLLHSNETGKLRAAIEQKGFTVVPLSLYLKGGWAKVELGVCRGKKQADKRETIRRKTAEREAERAMRRR